MPDFTSTFWRGKRVFLTGHTGFKGSWLALWLQQLGADVTGFALAPHTQPNLFELTHLNTRIHSLMGDVRDLAQLKQAILNAKPDIIFHLAAQSLVRPSYQDPVGTYQTNVMGTVNLLEAMRAATTAKVLINVTTDKCYENKEWFWGYREVDPMGGYDPYSSSKGCAELVTAAYRRSFLDVTSGKSIATVRAGNIIGGGDWSQDRLIPDMIAALSQGKKAVIRYPQAIRPWQHVLEPVSGYLLLAEKMWDQPAEFAQAWNFGPHEKDCRSVSYIADHVCALWGKNTAWELSAIEHVHEAKFLKLDISKAAALLEWRPRWSLEEALAKTVAWYQAVGDGEEAAAMTLQQIGEY